MGKDQKNTIAVLDIGSAKTVALICDVSDSGLRYRGHATTESRGSRKGVLVELDKAVQSIQRAVEAAEKMAECTVGNAVISIGGAHIKGITSRGGISLGSRPREVTREDVRTAVEKARSINLPPDREVLHLLQQEFILDDQAGVRDPAGMMASRLEVNLHLVTASASATQNVITSANRAGVHVDNTVYEALVAADCTLRSEEKDMGICLVDIGAGSSDLIVYCEGMAVHSGVVPVGGDHFTNDVAVGLRTPLVEAEKIKKVFGNTICSKVPEANEIEVPAVGDRPSRLMPQRFLAKILEPRARELFEHVRDNLRQSRALEFCATGLVLTGGGARLNGLDEICESVVRKPVRVGRPAPMAKLPAELAEPEFAAVLGMIYYGNRSRHVRRDDEGGLPARIRSFLARASM